MRSSSAKTKFTLAIFLTVDIKKFILYILTCFTFSSDIYISRGTITDTPIAGFFIRCTTPCSIATFTYIGWTSCGNNAYQDNDLNKCIEKK